MIQINNLYIGMPMLWIEDDELSVEGKIKNLIYNNIQKEILLRIEIEWMIENEKIQIISYIADNLPLNLKIDYHKLRNDKINQLL